MDDSIDFIQLEKDITRYKYLYTIIWAINIILVFIPIAYYYKRQIKLDFIFLILTALNILSLYLTYKISDKYNFLKYRYQYYKKLSK